MSFPSPGHNQISVNVCSLASQIRIMPGSLLHVLIVNFLLAIYQLRFITLVWVSSIDLTISWKFITVEEAFSFAPSWTWSSTI